MARIRDFGLIPGILPAGARNAITDVPGVRVGHRTIRRGDLHTGVTAVIPAPGNLFADKVMAAVEVINGFGKSTGLVQVTELGTIETPILLTNTFGAGTCANALIRAAIAENPDIGRATSTVNPVVLECNDGAISDIQAMAVTEADAMAALADAGKDLGKDFAEGAVGAGTGMVSFGFKGGIGSASRRIGFDGAEFIGHGFHLGVLVLANFGVAGDLTLPDGHHPHPEDISVAGPGPGAEQGPEKGSVIVILATDVPLAQRQLQRVVRRAGAGLARLGAFWGHGSGDIALGFTTANRIPHAAPTPFIAQTALDEARIDPLFRAAAEATQEAVLNALCAAPATMGRDGRIRPSLRDWLAFRARNIPG